MIDVMFVANEIACAMVHLQAYMWLDVMSCVTKHATEREWVFQGHSDSRRPGLTAENTSVCGIHTERHCASYRVGFWCCKTNDCQSDWWCSRVNGLLTCSAAPWLDKDLQIVRIVRPLLHWTTTVLLRGALTSLLNKVALICRLMITGLRHAIGY